jgi:hypothetical protein
LDQLARLPAPAPLSDAVALSRFLDLMPDPRGLRGRRYLLSALVAAAAASVLAGARSLTAITEWIADAPAWACRTLGFPVDPLTGAVSVPHPTPCVGCWSSSTATPSIRPSGPSSPPPLQPAYLGAVVGPGTLVVVEPDFLPGQVADSGAAVNTPLQRT